MEKIVLNVRSAQRDPMLLTIDPDRCGACGICVEYCPKHVLALGSGPAGSGIDPMVNVRRPEDCRGCALCQLYCPNAAINVRHATATAAA